MTEQQQLSAPSQTFAYLAIDIIDEPANAMRSNMADEDIDSLALSIKQVGLLEPIVVVARGERYEVVAGHRRLTACRVVGKTEVPCHIVGGTQEQIEVMKMHENLVRQDVNPVDEAVHYNRLMAEHKVSPTQIGRMINRGDTYVRNRLALLDWPEPLREAVRTGKLKLTVAAELSRIPTEDKLREMMGYAIGHGITGSVAKRWVDEQLPRENQLHQFQPDYSEQPGVVPASEQGTECFYCLQPVRLFAADNVYVHPECGARRQADAAAEPEPEPEPAPAT